MAHTQFLWSMVPELHDFIKHWELLEWLNNCQLYSDLELLVIYIRPQEVSQQNCARMYWFFYPSYMFSASKLVYTTNVQCFSV
jgi:hypothetical protein